jgi:hypothetical protein
VMDALNQVLHVTLWVLDHPWDFLFGQLLLWRVESVQVTHVISNICWRWIFSTYLKFIRFKVSIPTAATFITFSGRAIICSQQEEALLSSCKQPICPGIEGTNLLDWDLIPTRNPHKLEKKANWKCLSVQWNSVFLH